MINAAMAAIALKVSIANALEDTFCRVYTTPLIPVPMATSSKKFCSAPRSIDSFAHDFFLTRSCLGKIHHKNNTSYLLS